MAKSRNNLFATERVKDLTLSEAGYVTHKTLHCFAAELAENNVGLRIPDLFLLMDIYNNPAFEARLSFIKEKLKKDFGADNFKKHEVLIAKQISHLVDHGFIIREKDKNDKREIILRATDFGKKTLGEFWNRAEKRWETYGFNCEEE